MILLLDGHLLAQTGEKSGPFVAKQPPQTGSHSHCIAGRGLEPAGREIHSEM